VDCAPVRALLGARQTWKMTDFGHGSRQHRAHADAGLSPDANSSGRTSRSAAGECFILRAADMPAHEFEGGVSGGAGGVAGNTLGRVFTVRVSCESQGCARVHRGRMPQRPPSHEGADVRADVERRRSGKRRNTPAAQGAERSAYCRECSREDPGTPIGSGRDQDQRFARLRQDQGPVPAGARRLQRTRENTAFAIIARRRHRPETVIARRDGRRDCAASSSGALTIRIQRLLAQWGSSSRAQVAASARTILSARITSRGKELEEAIWSPAGGRATPSEPGGRDRPWAVRRDGGAVFEALERGTLASGGREQGG